MKKIPIRMAITILSLFIIQSINAQYKSTDLLPADPDVRIGKLPNGFTYYIRKNTKPQKKVELRLVVNVGSVLEDPDQLGLAHFMEHMNFNGSKNFPKNELVNYLQSIGVEFGADLNAYTDFDETVYILPVPSDNPEKLEKAFTILEDWAGNAQLEVSEIEKERGVVLEESRIGKGASERMRNVYFPILYNGSLYASRLPIGKDSIINSFNPEVLKRFYHDWYRPELMALIVVGDIDPIAIEQKIKSHFSGFKNPVNARKRPEIIAIPERKNNQAIVLTDKEQPYSILSIYHSLEKSKKVVNWKDYRATVIQTLYNKILEQRFEELTQQAKPPFVFGSSNSGNGLRGYKSHSSFALLGDNPVNEAVNAMVQTIESVRRYGFLPGELDRAKSNLLNEAERDLKDKDKSESNIFVDNYINHFLLASPVISLDKKAAFLKYALPGISLDEVNNFARSLNKNQGEFVLVTAPEKIKASLPLDSGLMQMVTKASISPIKPYTEKKIASSLLSQTPKKGRIIAETNNPKTGTQELQLSNGISITLKSTDFKNDEIIMSATRKGGYFNYTTDDLQNAKNAAMIVSEMGVGAFTPTDLRKTLAGKTIQASPFISNVEEGISGNSSVKDAEQLFQLVYLYFTDPAKNPDLFQSYISKQKGFIQNMKNDPFSYFEDTLIKIQFDNNPWAETFGNPADYDKISLDRSYAIYREIFNNAYGMHFTFVGNIDPVSFKPFIEQYIASLPAKPKENFSRDVGLRPARGVIEVEVRKGTAEDKKSMVNLFFGGETPYSYEAFLHQQALIDVINILITRELREEISGIYGGGMFGYILKRPYQHYFISTSFPCGPENTDKLTQSLFGIIRRIKEKGCEQADLDKVKESWKNQRRERIRQNNYWARQLSYMPVNDEDPAVFLTHDSILEKITVADVQAAARKYLDESNYIRGVLYPEK